MSDEDQGSLRDRALDLLVFAPVGLAATAVEEFPSLVRKGRQRLGVSVRSAHAVGRLTVAYGQRELQRRAGDVVGGLRQEAPGTAQPPPPTRAAATSTTSSASSPPGDEERPAPPETTAAPPRRRARSTRQAATPGATGAESRPLVDLAIPGYDTLPASQVVRRLDSLKDSELDAVYHYESRSRGRRTILHRIRQLKESNGRGGPAPDAT
jgi:hypothetical protein